MTTDGAVDLSADQGRMDVSLAELGSDELEQPLELAWERSEFIVRIDDELRRRGREQARESGGLLGRMPDEPAGLVALLDGAGEGTSLGTAVVKGDETTGYRFAVDLRTAGQAGVPVELSRAFEEGVGASTFAVEAWLDGTGLPRRMGYVVELEEVRSEGRLVLPERTIRATYELSGFGDAVDTGLGPR